MTWPFPAGAGDLISEEEIAANAPVISKETYWLYRVMSARIQDDVADSTLADVFAIERPDLTKSISPYAKFVRENKLNTVERLALVLAIAPHIDPRLLDTTKLNTRTHEESGIEDVGGALVGSADTLSWLVGTKRLEDQFEKLGFLYDDEHLFSVSGVLSLVADSGDPGQPLITRRLVIAPDYLARFTNGKLPAALVGAGLGARHLTTELDWDDLVVSAGTVNQLREIKTWLRQNRNVPPNKLVADELPAGYRAWFHGPPGTSKRLAAKLLGKSSAQDIYRIDLSQLLAAHTGEMKESLDRFLKMGARNDWILVFDQADALSEKRNPGSRSIVAEIANYEGLAIVVSESKKAGAIDLRDIDSVVYFPPPRPEQRLRIWKSAVPATFALAGDVDLARIASDYELNRTQIFKVVKTATLVALDRGESMLTNADLLRAIKGQLNTDQLLEKQVPARPAR